MIARALLLKSTSLFGGLDHEDILNLATLGIEYHYSSGETIFNEGDFPDRFYLVIEGRVKIAKFTSTGKELIVHMFTNNDMFGEVAVFDGMSYPASAWAMSEVRLLGIERSEFLAFLSENPSVSTKIINVLGSHLRDAHNRLRDMAGERVEQRIANILLMLSSKLGPSIPFTRQEIADMAGTTTETAIRVMSRFKDSELISSSRGKITILDANGLGLIGN